MKNNNQILISIEGNLPFSALSRHFIRKDVIRNAQGQALKMKRIYSSEYNRLYIPLAKIIITVKDLDELFESCIENSEASYYNTEYDYEVHIEYEKPSNYSRFLQYLTQEGIIEELKDYESYAAIWDYLESIIADHLSDFCLIHEEQPNWITDIKDRMFLNEICNCEDYPCCGHTRP
jgi:hypothetical protein